MIIDFRVKCSSLLETAEICEQLACYYCECIPCMVNDTTKSTTLKLLLYRSRWWKRRTMAHTVLSGESIWYRGIPYCWLLVSGSATDKWETFMLTKVRQLKTLQFMQQYRKWASSDFRKIFFSDKSRPSIL